MLQAAVEDRSFGLGESQRRRQGLAGQLVPKPEVPGPRKSWLLAVLPPHPLVTAQNSRGGLPRALVFRAKLNVSGTRAAL